MHIGIGCDHRGLDIKHDLIRALKEAGHTSEDFGCYDESSVDYPDIAKKVACAVVGGQCARGVLICFSGIGMSIAANKIKGTRAALCHNEFTARLARQHNDANILCLGAGVVGSGLAAEMVREFLKTNFEGARHERRLGKIAELEDSNGAGDKQYP